MLVILPRFWTLTSLILFNVILLSKQAVLVRGAVIPPQRGYAGPHIETAHVGLGVVFAARNVNQTTLTSSNGTISVQLSSSISSDAIPTPSGVGSSSLPGFASGLPSSTNAQSAVTTIQPTQLFAGTTTSVLAISLSQPPSTNTQSVVGTSQSSPLQFDATTMMSASSSQTTMSIASQTSTTTATTSLSQSSSSTSSPSSSAFTPPPTSTVPPTSALAQGNAVGTLSPSTTVSQPPIVSTTSTSTQSTVPSMSFVSPTLTLPTITSPFATASPLSASSKTSSTLTMQFALPAYPVQASAETPKLTGVLTAIISVFSFIALLSMGAGSYLYARNRRRRLKLAGLQKLRDMESRELVTGAPTFPSVMRTSVVPPRPRNPYEGVVAPDVPLLPSPDKIMHHIS